MKIKIYQPSATITQSVNKENFWLLKAEGVEHKSINNLTGWTSSDNTLAQLKLKFKELEQAISYVKSKGWDYFVVEAGKPKLTKKSYADNFTK